MGPVRDANEPSLIRTSDTNGGMRDNVAGAFGITVASASREFHLRVVNVLDLDLMSSVAEQMAAREQSASQARSPREAYQLPAP